MKKKLALVSGGFDPLHKGHISYIKAAKKFSKYLVVAVNSDEWLLRKKKHYFMSWEDRVSIIESLEFVDKVISFDDADDSASDAILQSLELAEQVLFCNGGDRSDGNCKELDKFRDNGRVVFHFGVGGEDKLNSSSWIIKDFYKKYSTLIEDKEIYSKEKSVKAPWGSHIALVDAAGYKFKELRVNPGAMLSLQKHLHREELWLVHKGEAFVEIDKNHMSLAEGDFIHIPKESKHRISNKTDEPLIILEIQRGNILEEKDIIRYEDHYGRLSS